MKIPYRMVAAVDNHKRHAQMTLALQYGWPRLQQEPFDETKSLSIACYGPSLQDTYKDLTHPILSMSGATRWLADHGVIADYHIDMDPRPFKKQFIDPPVPGVHYLMATVCHPDTWPLLKGQKVTLWHVYSCDETYDLVSSIDPDQLVVRGGSTIGLTALHIGGVMGYRHFEIHGMDGSFRDSSRSSRHAGVHYGTKQNKDGITWDVNKKTYYTSKIMANAVSETINAIKNFPIFCVFHGEGLTQALVREQDHPYSCCADQTEKAKRVRRLTANVMLAAPDAKTLTTAAWQTLYDGKPNVYKDKATAIFEKTKVYRENAKFNTGSVTLDQMMQLMSITSARKVNIAAEVGTFIGNSTLSIRADHIYTCDTSNDCFPQHDGVTCFPLQSSTEMLGTLVEHGQKVDLFFFDGRIQPPDLPLILKLMKPDTLFLFDDYKDTEKGMVNAKLMSPLLNGWILLEPDHRMKTTLAAIAPASWFKA